MLEIKLYNTKCIINGKLEKNIINEIHSATSYTHSGYLYMTRKYGRKGWDGIIRLFKNNSFPIGLLDRVRVIFDRNNLSYKIIDKRKKINYGEKLKIDKDSFFKPRGYQKDAVRAAITNGSGVVKIATGGGKTGTLAMIAGHYNVKTVIYVIGIELLYQMKNTIEALYPDIECGMIGDGKCDIKQINIATIWSAAAAFNQKAELYDSDVTYDSKKNKNLNKEAIRKVIKEAELFILDECQYAAANTVQFLHRISESARHRFLFSASPWRDTGDDILIEAVGGKKIFDLKASKLINDGFLVHPEIHFMSVPTMRGVGSTYQEVYKNYIVNNEKRNALIEKSVDKLVKAKKKVLILVVRINHGKKILELLKDKYSVEYLDGKKNSSERMRAIDKMKSGEVEVLIASKIFDQGVDIPELDALILAGSGKSTGRALQRIGRVIRKAPNKKKAIVVEFIDNAKYLRKHSDVRISVYKTEPEFKIKMYNNNEAKRYPKRKKLKWT